MFVVHAVKGDRGLALLGLAGRDGDVYNLVYSSADAGAETEMQRQGQFPDLAVLHRGDALRR